MTDALILDTFYWSTRDMNDIQTLIIIDRLRQAMQTGSGKHAVKDGYDRTVISGIYYSDITFHLNWT